MEGEIKKLVCEFMANDEIMQAQYQFNKEELENVADYTAEVCLYVISQLSNAAIKELTKTK